MGVTTYTSLRKAGSARLSGDVQLVEGTGSTITQSGNSITLGSSLAIGGPITSGTEGSVLFVGSGGVLSQDNADFNYFPTTSRLTVKGTQTFQPTAEITNMPFALVIDEATTNLVTNPSIEVNTTGWAASGANASILRSTSFAWIGAASLQVTVSPAATTQGVVSSSIAISALTKYVGSCYVYSTVDGENGQIVMTGNASGATTANFKTRANQWVRTWVTKITSAGDTSVTLGVRTNGVQSVVWYTDAFQLEQKDSTDVIDWPTSFCSGDMGPGYAWTGTAHNSSSTRQAGMHHLGPVLDNSTDPFIIRSTGAFGGTRRKFVFDNKQSSGGLLSHDTSFFQYEIEGSNPTASTIGAVEGIMRIRNNENGVALWVTSNSTSENIVIVDGPNVTSGSIFAVAAPSDLLGFTGFYIRFFDKSNRDMFTVKRDTFNYGNAGLGFQKDFRVIGGGGVTETLGSNLTGTIATTATSRTLTGTGTLFTTELVVGDTIKLSGLSASYVVETITSNTSLDVTAVVATTTSGNTYAKYGTQYGPPRFFLTGPLSNHKGLGVADPTSCLFQTRNDSLRLLATSFVAGSGTLTFTSGSGDVTCSASIAGIAVGDWIHAPGQTARAAGQAPVQVIRKVSNTNFKVAPAASATWVTASGAWAYQKHNQYTGPTTCSDGFSVHHTLSVDSSAAGPSASTTETSIFSALTRIRSGSFCTNRPIRITAYGTLSGANAGKTLTIRVKLGSTTIMTTHAEVIADTTTNNFHLVVTIAPNNSETSQKSSLVFKCQSPTTSVTDHLFDYETSSVDTTADQDLDITAQWGVAASTLTAEYKIVEQL